jgi:alkylresorcinol/alkylpyrone synthase
LCGLTFRAGDDSKANIIATTIFGDGAAAIVVRAGNAKANGEAAPRARIDAWGEHTWPQSRDIMGWRVEDDGLGVVFSRSIPILIRDMMRPVTDAFLDAHGMKHDDLRGLIVHPGGAKVLEALEQCYGLRDGELTDARAVLADHGNMSAVTVLAVLKRMLDRGAMGPHLMTALGPGFSVGMSLLELL